MGIKSEKVSLNLAEMMEYKNEGIDGNVKGIEFLFKKNNITGIFAEAKIISSNELLLTSLEGSEEKITASNIVIATGQFQRQFQGLKLMVKKFYLQQKPCH